MHEANTQSKLQQNRLLQSSARSGAAVTMATICWAVGIFYGKAGGTVRKYAEVAAQYDDATRLKYSVLSFHHFSLAKSLGSRALEMLDYSMDHIGTAAGAIYEQFAYKNSLFDRDPVEHRKSMEGDWGQDLHANNGDVGHPPTPEANIPWLNTLGRIIGDFQSVKVLITREDIPDDIKDDLKDSWAMMEKAIDRLSKYLTKTPKG